MTPRIIDLAWRAYERRRGWAAWFAGAPGKFKDLTFEQLAGITRRQRKAMSIDQMAVNLRRIAVGHNAALAARAGQQGTGDHGD